MEPQEKFEKCNVCGYMKTLTPFWLLLRWWDSELEQHEKKEVFIHKLDEDLTPCYGVEKCFMKINRGHFCSKHSTSTASDGSAITWEYT